MKKCTLPITTHAVCILMALLAQPIAAATSAVPGKDSGKIIRNYYDAVVKRDFVAARGFLADDMVFEGLFETYPNPDAYLKALNGLMGITTGLDIKTVIAQGDQVAIFYELRTKAPAEATTLVAEWFELHDGKILHAHSAFDGRVFAPLFVKPEH